MTKTRAIMLIDGRAAREAGKSGPLGGETKADLPALTILTVDSVVLGFGLGVGDGGGATIQFNKEE